MSDDDRRRYNPRGPRASEKNLGRLPALFELFAAQLTPVAQKRCRLTSQGAGRCCANASWAAAFDAGEPQGRP